MESQLKINCLKVYSWTSSNTSLISHPYD